MSKLRYGMVTVVALAAAGCAHARTQPVARATPRVAYGIAAVDFQGLPATELATSREWWRAESHDRVLARDDSFALRQSFLQDLGRNLTLSPSAPLKLRVTVRVQTPGDFLGLAAETTDLAATVDVIDPYGAVLRSVTVRETASAPLQRSRSRKERLEAGLARLSAKLATQLQP